MPVFDTTIWLLIAAVIAVIAFYAGRKSGAVKEKPESNLDLITQLQLRPAFEATVENLINSRTPFSIALIDIDHFKNVNDQFGHLAGDMVLKAIASSLITALSPKSQMYRWGGDEFAIILRKAEEPATSAIEQWIQQIASEPLQADKASVSITCSAGITDWREGEDQQGLFRRCDQALYRAKRAGRNQVMNLGMTANSHNEG